MEAQTERNSEKRSGDLDDILERPQINIRRLEDSDRRAIWVVMVSIPMLPTGEAIPILEDFRRGLKNGSHPFAQKYPKYAEDFLFLRSLASFGPVEIPENVRGSGELVFRVFRVKVGPVV